MINDEIREQLTHLQDAKYKDFQVRLIPSADPQSVIGVRTPVLRNLAKQLSLRGDIHDFLDALPHSLFEENQLHAFVLSGIKDYGECLTEVERFLPFVDNWATCDQMSPKVFKKHRTELIGPVRRWICSGETFTVRFGVGMLMEHYLDEAFDPAYPELVAGIRSEEYYVRMMIAWYFATALAKQYETVLPVLQQQKLDSWTHNRTIQKAIESYRITPDRKAYLRGLKI